MHRSRLATIMIDCNDLDAGTRFWTGALGTEVKGRLELGNTYVMVGAPVPSLQIWLQGVPDAKTAKSRIHLDFESDDVEAEVWRLEALGAVRHQQRDGWWTMQDPSGNEFCVLPRFTPHFDEDSHTWE